MEWTKVCIRCGENKPLSAFYKHKQMTGGFDSKCKDCVKKASKEREERLRKDPEWVEKEKTRAREKYRRLEYKDKHKPTPERKKIIMDKYNNKYPEKIAAKGRAKKLEGFETHHWSYNKKHYKDVFYINTKSHARLHRFIIYDQERFMYRVAVSLGEFKQGELLYTKEEHRLFLNLTLKEDY